MQETKIGTRKQVADAEIVPRNLISVPSLDTNGTDALRWALGLGWDRSWKDEKMDKVPTWRRPLCCSREDGWFIKGCDPPAIQNPVPSPFERFRPPKF